MDTNKKTVGRWLLAAALVGSTATSPVWAQDKVLRLSREMTFRSLDPAQQFDLYSGDITQLVFSSLLTYAHATEPPRLEPDLLARMPTVSADGKTYRFELRPGVRFHDCTCFPGGAGRELTADDVVYTFKRFADANVNVKSWSLLVDTIVGLDEFRAATQRDGAGTDYAKLDIAGIKALGKHEFTIELRAPNATFAHLLAISSLGITPVEAVRAFGADFGAKAVGSGPFMLERADNKGLVRLTKYTRYHRRYPGAEGSHPDAGKPLPLVDVIEMPLVEETQPAVLMLLEGKFDAGTLDRPTFSKMLERDAEGTLRLKPQHAGQYGVVQVPRFALTYVFLNTRDPLLANRSLREALAHLIDAQAINQVIEGGRHLLASGLVPDGLTGSSAAQPKVRRYDVAAAKAALAKAGYPGGKGLPPLTLSFSAANERMRTIFDLLRMKAAAAGVVLKPNYLDFATYAK